MMISMPSPREALVILNLIPGMGPIRIRSLLNHFGSPEIVLHSPKEFLRQIPHISDRLAEAIASWRECTAFQAEFDLASRLGVHITTLIDDDYPDILRSLRTPPAVLYSLGAWRQSDAYKAVALVGTRQATAYGSTIARQFGRELAEAGCTIISGLALGIDTAGHWGALDAGGRTLAILGSGLNALFPAENRTLAERIAEEAGAVISEFPLNLRPSKNTFPCRNRLVAGWSQAILVAEAPHRSGALHTARLGAELGRSVFAIPGPINRPSSEGCHELLRDGAILAASTVHILNDMNWGTRGNPAQGRLNFGQEGRLSRREEVLSTDPTDRMIIESILLGHSSIDQLCPATGLSAMELAPRLARLQIFRIIVPLPGGRFKVQAG